MVEGRGGLNIKDFPFAFSIAALFSPSILSGDSQTPLIGLQLILKPCNTSKMTQC